ncbi:MAG: hypothetical protein Q7T51_00375 [Candidatus Moranbacteria bacterium]|nr:hypothetical protein [Candidatus Moranbacteria bacterium]
MDKKYKGVIIEESLSDNLILNNLEIVRFKISKDENPADRWHLFTVIVSEDDIEKLSNLILDKWYMHFWSGNDIIAIFKGKKFEFKLDDKATWELAVQHGLSIGIPKEQLDFVTE